MYSSGEVQFFDLLKCLLLSGTFELLRTNFPSEALLERKDTPRCPGLDMRGLQAQQGQIRHKRDGHGSFHSRGIFGDLSLSQTQTAFQFLEADLHRPPSEIDHHDQTRARHGEIGHQQFGLFGALVTLPSTEEHGDIANMAQVGRFDKGPEGPVSVSGNKSRHPDLTIMVPGQMGDDIAQMLAIGKLPGAREGDDKEPPMGLNGLEVVPRGIGRIGHHDYRPLHQGGGTNASSISRKRVFSEQ